MTLRDELATALASHDDPDFGYPAGWAPTDFADAILADPAFRAALTDAIDAALDEPWHSLDPFGDGEVTGAAIVARMLGETT
jgi:hypothetical protein